MMTPPTGVSISPYGDGDLGNGDGQIILVYNALLIFRFYDGSLLSNDEKQLEYRDNSLVLLEIEAHNPNVVRLFF